MSCRPRIGVLPNPAGSRSSTDSSPPQAAHGHLLLAGFRELNGRPDWAPAEVLLLESRHAGPGPPRYPARARWRLERGRP